MKRELSGGFELDDDPGRVDLDAVWDYLSTEAYWGRERSRADIERQVHEAARVVGLYHEGRQIGFARVHSDGRLAYLADVYVLSEHRGRGLGVELVRSAVDEGPHRDLRWLLHTKDAHGLYERFGFGPPSDRVMERPPPS
ncbi:MAG TPA: GNAT family N-acetyltransferase [Actinomycetota bacterium]|nr:GNAT family N-acetyltransferase [Actinomycetota bacterium]